jgi:hypothetical protein
MATDYREMLRQPTESLERPKPLPKGNFIATIGQHEFGTSRNKGTPYIRFPLAIAEACADVDPAAIEGIDLSRRELRRDYFITPNALYRLGDMVDAVLGKKPGVNLDERLPDLRGSRVMVTVSQRASEQNSEEIYNDVDSIVAAP